MRNKTTPSGLRTMLASALLGLALAGCGKKDDGAKSRPAPAEGDAGGGAGTAATAPTTDAAAATPVAPPGKAARELARFGNPVRANFDAIQRAVVASDGSVLTCSREVVRLWDPAGALRWQHAGQLQPQACALSADGKRVAVIEQQDPSNPGSDRAARVHEVGGRPGPWQKEPSMAATWLGLDGDALVTVHRDKVQRWQGGTATVLATLPATATAADLSADRKTIAWSDGSKVYLHPVGAEPVALPVTAEGAIKRLALATDGSAIAVASDRKVLLWDVAGARARWTHAMKLSVPFTPAVAFRPDGAVYASTSGNLTLLDAATGSAASEPPPERFLRWTARGTAAVLRDRQQLELDLATGERTPAVEDPGPEWADEWIIGLDGSVTAWAAEDCKALRTWRGGEGGGERTLPAPKGCSDERDGLQGWRASATHAVSVGSSISFYDLASGKQLASFPLEDRPVEEVAISADGSTAVIVYGQVNVATDDPYEADQPARKQLRLESWTIGGGRKGEALREATDVNALALSPDGRRAYLGLMDGHVVAVDTATFGELERRGPLMSAVVSLDIDTRTGRIAATDRDGTTVIWQP